MYQALVPTINSRKVQLLDLPALETQLVALERRTARGGRESIDHPPGGHDDIANAVAGAIHLAAPSSSGYPATPAAWRSVLGDDNDSRNFRRSFIHV